MLRSITVSAGTAPHAAGRVDGVSSSSTVGQRIGQIVGGRAFEDEGDIRVERLRRDFRAAQADLLLHRERRQHIDRVRIALQHVDQQRTAHAVIKRFAAQHPVADFHEAAVEGDRGRPV